MANVGEALPSNRVVLYLSASLSNHALNERLRSYLPNDQFELVLPQEFAPMETGHPSFPRAIYDECIREMERCDAGLLLLDAFGVDCASEAGWFAGRSKPLIGIATASCHFLRHWMVKGNLTGVICLDPVVYDVVSTDPILCDLPILSVSKPEQIGQAIHDLMNMFAQEVTGGTLEHNGGEP